MTSDDEPRTMPGAPQTLSSVDAFIERFLEYMRQGTEQERVQRITGLWFTAWPALNRWDLDQIVRLSGGSIDLADALRLGSAHLVWVEEETWAHLAELLETRPCNRAAIAHNCTLAVGSYGRDRERDEVRLLQMAKTLICAPSRSAAAKALQQHQQGEEHTP